MRVKLAALALLAMLALSAGSIGHAQSGITVTNTGAESSFPSGIVFTLDASASAAFDDVRLSYQVAPDGVRVTAAPQCTGGLATHCTFTFANSQSSPLIPGALVTYSWHLVSGAATQDTPEKTVTYEDTRFDWRTLTDGNVTIWWYSGSEGDARAVLEAGKGSIDRMSALLHTTVGFPVKIFYYASAEDMQPAILANNAPGVITLGEVVFSDTAMVAADASPQEIARHEVAHIVERQAFKGPYGVPDWLNEGTAVYAQNEPLPEQRQAVESAVRSGEIISVRSLSSASSGALSDKVLLFYGESWSLVKFIIDSYGEEKFAQLFQVFKAGSNTAQALETVYGFDQDGLENAWRASVGLPAREPVTPEQTSPPPTSTASAQNAPGSDDGGASVLVIVVIAVLTAIVAGGLVTAGVLLARRYR